MNSVVLLYSLNPGTVVIVADLLGDDACVKTGQPHVTTFKTLQKKMNMNFIK